MAEPNGSGPWYREPWPWILMAGPAAVVVAGLVTLYLAVAHRDPLVVDNYYKEGLAINRVLERDDAARQAGYRAQVLVGEDGTRVRVHLSAAAALPQQVRLRLFHPTQAGLDREAMLAATQAGWYEGEIGAAAAPRWRVELEDAGRGWRLIGEWRPSEGGAFALEPRD
jgi:hypothetical protein